MLITPRQVEEWIREIEERPASAPAIIRQIAKRLSELTDMNEQLLAENIVLKNGSRVQEYESRITNLEYQLEMLKRQVGNLPETDEVVEDTWSVILYEAGGRVFRVLLTAEELISGELLSSLDDAVMFKHPQLVVVNSHEELLFVFDSGRTETMPTAKINPTGGGTLDWEEALQLDVRGGEELVTVLPIGKMALYDYCIQISRRGYTKKIRESFLETCIASGNVGTGVISTMDRTCSLVLCSEMDKIVVVSRDGALANIPVAGLPFTIQESFRLNSSDHVQTAIVIHEAHSFVAITQNGMVFHRETEWLEPSEPDKIQVRAILSKSRREAGMCIVGAGSVQEDHWGLALISDGKIVLHQMGQILDSGSLLERGSELQVLSFVPFKI